MKRPYRLVASHKGTESTKIAPRRREEDYNYERRERRETCLRREGNEAENVLMR